METEMSSPHTSANQRDLRQTFPLSNHMPPNWGLEVQVIKVTNILSLF